LSRASPNNSNDDFKAFIKNAKERVFEKKSLFRIIIFGPYYPPQEKELLIKLKNDLRTDGFKNTRLVEDLPNYDDLLIREKSFLCLEYSDINFFIITSKGVQGGVTVELDEIIPNAEALSFKTVVFYEIRKNKESLSVLVKEGLELANIRHYPFKRDDYYDLFELVLGKARARHYYYVKYSKYH